VVVDGRRRGRAGGGLEFDPAVRDALERDLPVVALETTVLAHGLPWPQSLESIHEMIAAVHDAGAVPAVVGIVRGRPRIGLEPADLERFAHGGEVPKASLRDLAPLAARGADGATTVAATVWLAERAGIAVVGTGGIGGVHRLGAGSLDVSADLRALGRCRVGVVCSGAKSVLDLGLTLEALETEGVAVVGFGTDRLPAFWVRDGGLALRARVDTPAEAAEVLCASRDLGGPGVVIANPVALAHALSASEVEAWTNRAQAEAGAAGVSGARVTPYLLNRLAELSEGRTVAANRALLADNAALAGRIARALAKL
jgi:pseudouridine-5'-phosphate glycosidase